MNKSKYKLFLSAIALITGMFIMNSCTQSIPKTTMQTETKPIIFPDYTDITIPNNLAPINFRIEEKAQKHLVLIKGDEGKGIRIKSTNQLIDIPQRKWKKFLKINTGKSITIEIFSKKKGEGWVKYPPIKNIVSSKSIDSHIAFRHINAGYILWEKMGIYQRNLENFSKDPILLNDRTDKNCMNCHSFGNYDPGKMMIHLRRPPSGTLLYNNNEATMLNTSTPYTMSACVYPAWHPNGKIIAYSVNLIEQRFHTAVSEKINVYDKASDIVLYDIEKNIITTTPELSTRKLENLPTWSPKGDYLYYIVGPEYHPDSSYQTVKYDLMRIAYNEHNGTWGKPETLLKSSDTGMSITFPEVSPNGKYLVFCMANQGYFTVYNPTSNLYILNLETGQYNELPVNSNHVESYHSWSSDGNWLLFISKRLDGIYSRVYFTCIDEKGKATKPFILPQKDPGYNEKLTVNYNRPVFVKGKVKIRASELARAAFNETREVIFDPSIDIDALSGASRYQKRDVINEHTN
jgi:hypothetical protein